MTTATEPPGTTKGSSRAIDLASKARFKEAVAILDLELEGNQSRGLETLRQDLLNRAKRWDQLQDWIVKVLRSGATTKAIEYYREMESIAPKAQSLYALNQRIRALVAQAIERPAGTYLGNHPAVGIVQITLPDSAGAEGSVELLNHNGGALAYVKQVPLREQAFTDPLVLAHLRHLDERPEFADSPRYFHLKVNRVGRGNYACKYQGRWTLSENRWLYYYARHEKGTLKVAEFIPGRTEPCTRFELKKDLSAFDGFAD